MANASSRYFSNALVGLPQVGADVNVLETHALPKFAVGTGFTRQDGSMFRYGYSAAGVGLGLPVAPTFASAGSTTISNAVIVYSSAVAVAGEVIQPGDAGSRYFEITKAAITADLYKGGYVIISDGSGAGYTYRIKGNTATGNPASGNIRVELYEKLAVRIGPNTDVIIVPSLWNDVAVADGTNAAVAGVSMSTTTSSLPYGWFCVRGQVGAYQDGAWTIGCPLVVAANGLGALGAALTNTVQLGTTSKAIVGYAVQNGADNTFGVAHINIE